MANIHYTKSFYEEIRYGSMRSAQIVMPLVLELLHPRSIVDVGCGDGSWLNVCRSLGVNDILGVDGDYVRRDTLQIPEECFRAVELTKAFDLGRGFDLAISLEVGEHLPANSAGAFVESLVRLAPVVLFSAAIPLQGGNHHINEQWPDTWAELFRRYDYLPVDFVRRQVWENVEVSWWYAQNTVLFVQEKLLRTHTGLKCEFERTDPGQLRLVHPRNYLEVVMPARPVASGVREASRLLLVCLRNAVHVRAYSLLKRARSRRGSKSSKTTIEN